MAKVPPAAPAQRAVEDPQRLRALVDTGLLDSPSEAAFDRLTDLACRLLGVPVSLVSLVDKDRQFFKSSKGLPEPWATQRQTPLTHSFCQHVVSTEGPLIISDARTSPLVQDNLAIRDLGVIAYLGIPLRDPNGAVLGSFCAIDSTVRTWSDEDVQVLTDLAQLVMTEVELRHHLRASNQRLDALQASEERFRLAAQATNDIIRDWNLKDDHVAWNTALATHLGDDEAVEDGTTGDWWVERLHASDRPGVLASLQAALEGDATRWSASYRLRRADGTYAQVHDRGFIQRSEAGAPLRLISALADQSEQRRLEGEREALVRDLEAERAQFEAVIRQMPAALLVADYPSGELIMANKQVEEILRHPFDPVAGFEQYSRYKALRPDGTPMDVEAYPLVRALLQQDVVQGEEVLYERGDGSIATLLVSAAPVYNPAGDIIAAIATFTDITARKEDEAQLRELNTQLEQRVARRTVELERVNEQLRNEIAERSLMDAALRGSEARYRSVINDVIDHVSVGVFILDADFNIVWVNQAMARFFGLDRDAVIGKPKRALIHNHIQHVFEDPARFAERVLGTYDDNTYTEHFECHVLAAEGREERWLEHWSKPIQEGSYAGGRVELYTDVTAIRQTLRTLGRTNAELKHRNRELQEFAYVASHDLQEPLRKIRSFGNLLEVEYEQRLDDQARHYLARMQHAADRMSTLISDLLSFSRVMTRGRPFELVPLSDVVETVVDDLQQRFEEVGAVVQHADLPAIEADATQLGQLFQNLFLNAIKFRRPGVLPRIEVCATVEAGVDRPEAMCRIEVRDNGMGFEPRYAEKIFMPFQRLHTRSEIEGTGIGLAICRRIAERHGGTIRGEGVPGEGSTFIVTLPIQQAPMVDIEGARGADLRERA